MQSSNFWYLFNCTSVSVQVTGMVPCELYVFNIINFETPGSQFKQGMQPLLFSVKEAETCGRGWVRVGENVTYFTNKYKFRDVSPVKRRQLALHPQLAQFHSPTRSLLTAAHAHLPLPSPPTTPHTSSLYRHTCTQVYTTPIQLFAVILRLSLN